VPAVPELSWKYRRWDGSQESVDLSGKAILDQLSDDLTYHGDLDAALRAMMTEGFVEDDGSSISGLRDLLEQLRAARRAELDRHDPDGVVEAIAAELDEVLAEEHRSLDALERAATGSADEARRATSLGELASRRQELDLAPEDLAGQLAALARYSFTSSVAHDRFEALLASLRHDLIQGALDSAAAFAASSSAGERERLAAMLGALNTMIDQAGAGLALDPSFQAFMDRFGDLVPGSPVDLDELVAQLAAQMAATSSLLSSMSPEQAEQLAALSDQIWSDLELSTEMSGLAARLRSMMPTMGWDRHYPASGATASSLGEVQQCFARLGDLDRLERLLRAAPTSASLAEVDPERVRSLLGADAARSLERLAGLSRRLEAAGLANRRGGHLELTPKALRRLGQHALDELFKRLERDRFGDHQLIRRGIGRQRADETRPYAYGDPFDLDLEQTLRSALHRAAGEIGRTAIGHIATARRSGAQAIPRPIRLAPGDFEIHTTEESTTTATVVCIDLSLSMPMRQNFLAAKKVAMALQSLITSRFPRDFLGLVGFSELARPIGAGELPSVSWDYVYGTNIEHALRTARKMLAPATATKQVVLITDGEPTAHVVPGGGAFFHYPPTRATITATLREVAACTKAGITINTFVLDATGELREFVRTMTQLNRGRAFFTTPERLGDYVLVDFLAHRSTAAAHRPAIRRI
jgi:uncharacterized protein with von Willebrand factor type A (vWA) domain